MTTTIAPSLGAGIDFTQGGVGSTPGYSALDIRRAAAFGLLNGPIGSGYPLGAYAVTQRGSGANMSVDIAASTGGGIAVAGSTISNQGLYIVPPHSGVINEAIAAADPSNPRIDQIIVQCFDNAIDSSGSNTSKTTVLTGTPTAGATIGIGGNRNGVAAVPANCYRLADVLVPAGATSITNANIMDQRGKTRGSSIVATSETRTNAAYGLMPTPDQVTQISVPASGLIAVWFQATWQESVSGAARAAIFLSTNQLKVVQSGSTSPQTQGAATGAGTVGTNYSLGSCGAGLISQGGPDSAYTGDVTTGQAVGMVTDGTANHAWWEIGGSVNSPSPSTPFAGPCWIRGLPAGTYHISVQFKASSGNVVASNRALYVASMLPDQAVLG